MLAQKKAFWDGASSGDGYEDSCIAVQKGLTVTRVGGWHINDFQERKRHLQRSCTRFTPLHLALMAALILGLGVAEQIWSTLIGSCVLEPEQREQRYR